MSFARPDTPRTTSRGPRAARQAWRSPYGARLALGYAALFALGAVLLLGGSYATLGLVLERQDAAYLRDQLGAVEAAYRAEGLGGVERYAQALAADDLGEEVLIRISDGTGATVLLVLPDAWQASDLAALTLPREGHVPGPRRIVNAREEQDLDVLTRPLGGGALEVGLSSDERDDTLQALPRVFGWIAGPLVALALLAGVLMARAALRPLRRLVGTLESITTTGDVHARAPIPPGGGEVARLIRLFNGTLDRIEALVEQLRRATDDVAHDLRTPLTAIRGAAEVALSREREPAAYRAALERVVEASRAAQETLDSVMDAAEAESGTLRLDLVETDLDALVRDVASLYELVADGKGVALTLGAGQQRAGRVWADAPRLRRALAQLLDNAVKYTPPGGRVRVTSGRSGASALVEVRDTGPGIAPGEADRIWERLYRSESTRYERGLGLGLGLARAVARAHGGDVVLLPSQPAGGAHFALSLPLTERTGGPAGPPELEG
jgi:signal transduction histidine kinase